MDLPYLCAGRTDKLIPKKCYLSQIPAISYLQKGNVLKFNDSITFFVRDDGTGKTTLIEAFLRVFMFFQIRA